MPSWFKKGWDSFFGYIESLFEDHKFVRRFIVFWAVSIITYVVWVLFRADGAVLLKLSTAPGSVVISVIGILSTTFLFYQWLRERNK